MLRNVYSIHKCGNYCLKHKIPFLPKVLKLVEKIFFPACDIPFTAEIGNGTFSHIERLV